MIIIRLAGGLGNQIFQLGAGLLIAQRTGDKKIIINDSALQNYKTKRTNCIFSLFNLDLNYDIKKYWAISNILSRLRIPRLFPLKLKRYIFVSDKNFKTIYDYPNKFIMVLDGYFQKCLEQNNFDDEINILKGILKFDVSKSYDRCVIHIRGSDFLKLKWNSVAPLEYYRDGVVYLKEKYDINFFYVLTDDIVYAKFILNELKIRYKIVASENIFDDFKFLAASQYRLLSASTFSLMASALGNNEQSLVIAPKYWSPGCARKIVLPNEISIDKLGNRW